MAAWTSVGYCVAGSADTSLMNASASDSGNVYLSSSVASLYEAFEGYRSATVAGASEMKLRIV